MSGEKRSDSGLWIQGRLEAPEGCRLAPDPERRCLGVELRYGLEGLPEGEALEGLFLCPLSRHHRLWGLARRGLSEEPQPELQLPSFVCDGVCVAQVSGLHGGHELRLCFFLGSRAGESPELLAEALPDFGVGEDISASSSALLPRPGAIPTVASRLPSGLRHHARSLREVGHSFVAQHKRAPTAQELSHTMVLPLALVEYLLAATHAPFFGGSPRLRFGVGQVSPHQLDSSGLDFDLSRERIRPIDATALRRLQHPQPTPRLRHHPEPEQ